MPYDEFVKGPNWQQSSGPYVNRKFQADDLWPHGAGSETGGGNKDALTDGLHPVLAVDGQTVADGRPLNVTGVVVSYLAATETVILNVADGYIVRAYVANVTAYAAGDADTFETAPSVGQPVYVDDSDDLSAGVTLSMSPLNDATVWNPMAGILMRCQDEYTDGGVGGAIAAEDDPWPKEWANTLTEYAVCVMLFNGWREFKPVG